MFDDSPSRRTALRASLVGAGLAVPLATRTTAAAATAAATSRAANTVFDVTAYGATGDGVTDDTASIQSALTAAGKVPGATVVFPPAAGGCYRVSGVTVPAGVGTLRGDSILYSSDGSTTASLTGSVLAPVSTAVSTLLTIGVSGNGTSVDANPHGLTVNGLGFLGTAPGAKPVAGLWGAVVIDTSDVTFSSCRDLFCGGNVTGATGGFAQFLSSGTGNSFSVNGRVIHCSSFGAGTFVLADGLSSAYPGGGSTDGRLVDCQIRRHGQGIVLGPANAGAGGWSITESHFSSEVADSHVSYGLAGQPWTLRLYGCYFDVCGGPHVICDGRGLQAAGNYFKALTQAESIRFGPNLSAAGRDPAALLTGNTFDLAGATSVKSFVRFTGFTAAQFAAHGGGEYRDNLVHNHGAAMPKSWVAQYLGSDGAAIADAKTGQLTIAQGPVLNG